MTKGTPQPGALDRRLINDFPAAKRYMVLAAFAQLIATAALVAEMVAVASLIAAAVDNTPHSVNRTMALGVALIAAVVRALVLAVSDRAGVTMTTSVLRTLGDSVTAAVAQRSPRARADARAGELAISITRGVEQLESYFSRYLPALVNGVLIPVVVLCWIASVDLVSAAIIVVIICVIPFAMIHFGRQAERTTARNWRSLASLAGRFHELISGLATLRALGREQQGRREVEGATTAVAGATMATIKVAFRSSLALEFLAGAGVGLVAMMLGFRLLWGQLPLASALAVLLVTPEVFLPLRRVGTEFHAAAEGRTAAARLFELLDAQHRASETRADMVVDLATTAISLDGLSVVDGEGHALFSPLDLVIEPGMHVAISGPSGVGKSSVLAILAGLEAPNLGTVRVGTTPMASLDLDAYQRQLSFVPQHPHLFATTLRANLILGAQRVTTDRLDQVITWCELDGVIASLPDGLDTMVGEGGQGLSGGERQRVAIARAVLRDAPVVLFDEAASALDHETASRLRGALGPWLDSRTVITVDHGTPLIESISLHVELTSLIVGTR